MVETGRRAANRKRECNLAIAIRPGVTMPDWSVVASGTVGEALAAIFETCNWRQRWAGLNEAEDRMRRTIVEAYARSGHAPSCDTLALATGFATSQVRVLVARLAARDMVVLDPDSTAIIGAYPFVDRESEHRVHLRGKVLNAMCAIDALGSGAMLGHDVVIKSACRYCGAPIHVQTKENGAALADYAPQQAVVWTGIQYANNCAANSLCTTMAFFCSNTHLNTWLANQTPEPAGYRLSMAEGLQLGQAIFMPLLAPGSSSTTQ